MLGRQCSTGAGSFHPTGFPVPGSWFLDLVLALILLWQVLFTALVLSWDTNLGTDGKMKTCSSSSQADQFRRKLMSYSSYKTSLPKFNFMPMTYSYIFDCIENKKLSLFFCSQLGFFFQPRKNYLKLNLVREMSFLYVSLNQYFTQNLYSSLFSAKRQYINIFQTVGSTQNLSLL